MGTVMKIGYTAERVERQVYYNSDSHKSRLAMYLSRSCSFIGGARTEYEIQEIGNVTHSL